MDLFHNVSLSPLNTRNYWNSCAAPWQWSVLADISVVRHPTFWPAFSQSRCGLHPQLKKGGVQTWKNGGGEKKNSAVTYCVTIRANIYDDKDHVFLFHHRRAVWLSWTTSRTPALKDPNPLSSFLVLLREQFCRSRMKPTLSSLTPSRTVSLTPNCCYFKSVVLKVFWPCSTNY